MPGVTQQGHGTGVHQTALPRVKTCAFPLLGDFQPLPEPHCPHLEDGDECPYLILTHSAKATAVSSALGCYEVQKRLCSLKTL